MDNVRFVKSSDHNDLTQKCHEKNYGIINIILYFYIELKKKKNRNLFSVKVSVNYRYFPMYGLTNFKRSIYNNVKLLLSDRILRGCYYYYSTYKISKIDWNVSWNN